jgi:hypothetical protein
MVGMKHLMMDSGLRQNDPVGGEQSAPKLDVTPAEAGVHLSAGAGCELDPCLRRNDSRWVGEDGASDGGRFSVRPPMPETKGRPEAAFICLVAVRRRYAA